MAVNKVTYGGETLIDLTGDTVTAATLAQGVKAHDKTGASIIGELVASATKIKMGTITRTAFNKNPVTITHELGETPNFALLFICAPYRFTDYGTAVMCYDATGNGMSKEITVNGAGASANMYEGANNITYNSSQVTFTPSYSLPANKIGYIIGVI